jgi:hypothetical protein
MRLISHRGNIKGSIPELENEPDYILETAKSGYDVEIDVWVINEVIYLGHDKPQYNVNLNFIKNNKFWCHAKNSESLKFMLKNKVHCFWHQADRFTLTSQGFIWCYPNNPIDGGVLVTGDFNKSDIPKNIYGICSDFVSKYEF